MVNPKPRLQTAAGSGTTQKDHMNWANVHVWVINAQAVPGEGHLALMYEGLGFDRYI